MARKSAGRFVTARRSRPASLPWSAGLRPSGAAATAAPKPIAELFGRLVKPLFVRVSAATKEGRTLVALRATLLPKLTSSQLRVKDAERLVPACGLTRGQREYRKDTVPDAFGFRTSSDGFGR